jgi:hypothetical protein
MLALVILPTHDGVLAGQRRFCWLFSNEILECFDLWTLADMPLQWCYGVAQHEPASMTTPTTAVTKAKKQFKK